MKNLSIKVIARRKKRVGRGYGSGKGGHTVGKGQKGQKTRKKLGILFEGVKVKKSLIKRLPFLRGKNRFKSLRKPIALNIEKLESLPENSIVDVKLLVERAVVPKSAMKIGVKILGKGKISKKLTVRLPLSKSASQSIVKAGGKVE